MGNVTETGRDKLGLDYITCPECKARTKSDTWLECSVYCEDCGEHDGLKCPECEEEYDHVWGFDKLIKASEND